MSLFCSYEARDLLFLVESSNEGVVVPFVDVEHEGAGVQVHTVLRLRDLKRKNRSVLDSTRKPSKRRRRFLKELSL